MLNKNGTFAKGHKPWNFNLKGIHISPKTEFKKGGPVNEKHPGWTGDNVKYHAVHRWIDRHHTKSNSCDHCGTTTSKRLEWANISKQYLRDRDDWLTLCTSCHIKFDRLPERKAIPMRVRP